MVFALIMNYFVEFTSKALHRHVIIPDDNLIMESPNHIFKHVKSIALNQNTAKPYIYFH